MATSNQPAPDRCFVATPALRPDEGGFSLIEVMVSVTVMVVGVLGLFSSIVSSGQLEKSARSYSSRARVVNDALERLRNGPLTTRAQEFAAAPVFTEKAESVTIQFSAATLTRCLPSYSSKTSPFQVVQSGGNGHGVASDNLQVIPANATAPGLLPIRMTVKNGAEPIVLEALAANR